MNTNEEFFKKAFELAKQNYSEININNSPKKLSDEENKRLKELNNRIEMLSNKIDSSKLSKLTPDPQWIEEHTEAIKEREVINSLYRLFDIHKDGHAIKIFEDLEKAVNARIVQQISNTNKPCILIIGDDYELTKAVVSLAYYTHTKNILKNKGTYKGFYYIQCSGQDTSEVKDMLYQDLVDKYPCSEDMPCGEYKKMRETANKPKESRIAKYRYGATLFLNCVKDEIILKRLAAMVEDEASDGLIIVSTKNTDNIPSEFLNVSQIINLKLTISFDNITKTIIINEKKYPTIPERKYKLFELLYRNKERLVSKREIMEHLETGGIWDESQVFKLINEIKKMCCSSDIEIKNTKETKNKAGGYQMIIQK